MKEEKDLELSLDEAVNPVEYNEDNIRHLDDMEHIRVRSGMYIGRLGDGQQNDDGIHVLYLLPFKVLTVITSRHRPSCPVAYQQHSPHLKIRL